MNMQTIGQRAKVAARQLQPFDSAAKNQVLLAIADELNHQREAILSANTLDLEEGQKNGLTAALLDRLSLQKRLDGVIQGVCDVVNLPDPVGVEFDQKTLPNGLQVRKRRVPIGVMGVI